MAAKMVLFCIACVKINLCCDGENRHPEFDPASGRFGRGFQYDRGSALSSDMYRLSSLYNIYKLTISDLKTKSVYSVVINPLPIRKK